jgi:hypothetical protein
MGFTQIHTDLMFTALDYFIGEDTPVQVFRDDLGISFETALGNQGLVVPNEEGNWDIILNNSTQTIEIRDFGFSKAYNLKKHEGQSGISSLEIELSGTSTDNLYVVYGPTKDQLVEQIQLKKGTIDFQKSTEWRTNNCSVCSGTRKIIG